MTGCCGEPGPDTGLRLLSLCPGCGCRRYALGFRYDLAIRELPKERPDFLAVWPMIGRKLCSDRAHKLLEQFDADAVDFTDATSLTKPLRPGDADPPPFLSDDCLAAINAIRNTPQPG
ncbi:MAG: hypothetical protein ACK4GW_01335 [Pseudorhodobacter sp.]